MKLGLGLSLPNIAAQGVSLPRRIAAIFRKPNLEAHLYMPGVGRIDGFTTGNYLESTGNTNASVDGAVGLVLDAAGGVGAELIVNGDFSNGTTGWVGQGATISSYGEKLSVTTSSGAGGAWQDVPTVAGKTYEVVAGFDSAIAASLKVYVGGAFTTTLYNGTDSATIRQERAVFQATSSTSRVYLRNGGIATCLYDNISVRELTGTHATQATTANKPVLRRGIVNLLTYSADFSNAVWTVVGGTTKSGNAITYPTGGSLNPVRRNYTFKAGETYTVAMDASVISGVATGSFDLQNIDSKSFTLGNGLVVATFTPAADRTWLDIQMTGASVVSVGAIAVFQGTVTAEEIIDAGGIPLTTTAPASSSAGKYWWEFVASGLRRMDLGSVPFGMADDHVVVASGRCNSATGRQVLFAIRAASVANPIVCEVAFNSGYPQARWRNDAGTALSLQSPTAIVGQNCVIRAVAQGGTGYLYVNGVLVGSALLPGGATTVNMATIGAASNGVGGYGDFLDGALVELTPIKGQLSASDAKSLEKYHGSLAGVQIP